MKKVLKRLGTALGVLLLLLLLAAVVLFVLGHSGLEKPRNIQPVPPPIATDSATVAAGQQWATTLCTGCHGENYAGTHFLKDTPLGSICAPNLTPAGVGKTYSDADWVKAIRYGVRPTGQALVIMPSENFQYLSDEHLGQLIAYLKSLPPVEQSWPERRLSPLSKVLYQLGALGQLPADLVDRSTPIRTAPLPAVTVEYGQYRGTLSGCQICHGKSLTGGKSPEEGSPLCPDISSSSRVAQWGAEAFVNALRTGNTPDGRTMDPKFMPWREHGRMDDVALKAIYTWLQSMPEKDAKH